MLGARGLPGCTQSGTQGQKSTFFHYLFRFVSLSFCSLLCENVDVVVRVDVSSGWGDACCNWLGNGLLLCCTTVGKSNSFVLVDHQAILRLSIRYNHKLAACRCHVSIFTRGGFTASRIYLA